MTTERRSVILESESSYCEASEPVLEECEDNISVTDRLPHIPNNNTEYLEGRRTCSAGKLATIAHKYKAKKQQQKRCSRLRCFISPSAQWHSLLDSFQFLIGFRCISMNEISGDQKHKYPRCGDDDDDDGSRPTCDGLTSAPGAFN